MYIGSSQSASVIDWGNRECGRGDELLPYSRLQNDGRTYRPRCEEHSHRSGFKQSREERACQLGPRSLEPPMSLWHSKGPRSNKAYLAQRLTC
jgi:hypothetical protein